MSGEPPVTVFLPSDDTITTKKTAKEERKKKAELNELYYIAENHEKEQLLLSCISEYYAERPEYYAIVRSIISKKADKQTEKHVNLLHKLNTLLCKKKIRGLHNRHASAVSSEYNLCYFIPEHLTKADGEKKEEEEYSYIPINLLDSYYGELRHYQMRYFDGFRDRQRHQKKKSSISRLNYFKWVNEIQLWSHMNQVEQLVIRLETSNNNEQKANTDSKKRKRNAKNKQTITTTTTTTTTTTAVQGARLQGARLQGEIYLFHHPQYLTLPEKPKHLTRITLDPDVEERILRSCPLYETAMLPTITGVALL